mmetsp:Transcript_7590/g.18089  ORF Transcript_7590/g.18089 Transcript_7590/m.18089 type:complete len:215 (-) Transcript_7590:1598-2242(-)
MSKIEKGWRLVASPWKRSRGEHCVERTSPWRRLTGFTRTASPSTRFRGPSWQKSTTIPTTRIWGKCFSRKPRLSRKRFRSRCPLLMSWRGCSKNDMSVMRSRKQTPCRPKFSTSSVPLQAARQTTLPRSHWQSWPKPSQGPSVRRWRRSISLRRRSSSKCSVLSSCSSSWRPRCIWRTSQSSGLCSQPWKAKCGSLTSSGHVVPTRKKKPKDYC